MSSPAIAGSRVHQQSESGVLVPVVSSCASTLRVGIEEFHLHGEGSKPERRMSDGNGGDAGLQSVPRCLHSEY